MADMTTTESERRAPPCALVIFGASGDLTARKLLPALERLAADGALPTEVALVGVARTADDRRRVPRLLPAAASPGDGQHRGGAS